jgi:RimJ/RimL family protein N-acetyltransferase
MRIGTCGINDYSQAHRWAELVYELAPAHWGKRLFRKAVAAVIERTCRQDLEDLAQAPAASGR